MSAWFCIMILVVILFGTWIFSDPYYEQTAAGDMARGGFLFIIPLLFFVSTGLSYLIDSIKQKAPP
ncbi:MAG: hypothetical protein Q7R54_03465 [bacterium]|nr:hypothetical protein [bacterium]